MGSLVKIVLWREKKVSLTREEIPEIKNSKEF
jgi:hypothetical protein